MISSFFSSSFTKDDSVHSVHTQKTSHLYFQPEKNFWMVMTLNVPYEVKTKDGTKYNEYKGDSVLDSVYESVLKQSYKMFKLFMGTYTDHFIGNNEDERVACLREKLSHFYSKVNITIINCKLL